MGIEIVSAINKLSQARQLGFLSNTWFEGTGVSLKALSELLHISSLEKLPVKDHKVSTRVEGYVLFEGQDLGSPNRSGIRKVEMESDRNLNEMMALIVYKIVKEPSRLRHVHTIGDFALWEYKETVPRASKQSLSTSVLSPESNSGNLKTFFI